MVLRAGQSEGSDERDRALAALCRNYWFPLYAFARYSGKSPEDAEDLTQAFFSHLLQESRLGKLDPKRGRFRSFLLAALKRFMIDDWRRSRSEKRGGDTELFSLDREDFESRIEPDVDSAESVDRHFDRAWAVAIVDRVYAQLEAEYEKAGKPEVFRRLRQCLLGEAESSYAELAAETGMSLDGFTMAVYRLRRRFGEKLRHEIAQTIDSPEEIDEELRWLFLVLSGEFPEPDS